MTLLHLRLILALWNTSEQHRKRLGFETSSGLLHDLNKHSFAKLSQCTVSHSHATIEEHSVLILFVGVI